MKENYTQHFLTIIFYIFFYAHNIINKYLLRFFTKIKIKLNLNLSNIMKIPILILFLVITTLQYRQFFTYLEHYFLVGGN